MIYAHGGLKFRLEAKPYVTDSYCKCGHFLETVSNGLLSEAMYCSKCDSVYILCLRKLEKKFITKEFLEQCRKEVKGAYDKF